MQLFSSQLFSTIAAELHPFTGRELVAFCRHAGVNPRQARLIIAEKKADTVSTLRLCSVFGIDPLALNVVGQTCSRRDFHFSFLDFAICVGFSRARQGLSIRTAARRVGVSIATLSRAEAGRPLAVESYLRICQGFALLPQSFFVFTGNNDCNSTQHKNFLVGCDE